MADPLSPEDLQALHFAQAHLQAAGDPRAEKLGAFLRANTSSLPSPGNPIPSAPEPFMSEDRLGGRIATALSKGWTALNTPVGDFGGHSGRTQDLLTKAVSTGAVKSGEDAEQQINRVRLGESPAWAGTKAFIAGSLVGKDASVVHSAANMVMTPLGLMTFGVGGVLSKLGQAEVEAQTAVNSTLDMLHSARASGANAEVVQGLERDLAMARDSAQRLAMLHRGGAALTRSAGAGFAASGGQQALEASKGLNSPDPKTRAQAVSELAEASAQVAFGLHGGLSGHPEVGPNPTEQVGTADRPEPAPIINPQSEYQRLKQRLQEIEQHQQRPASSKGIEEQSTKGSNEARAKGQSKVVQPEPTSSPAVAAEFNKGTERSKAAREPVPPAEKPQVAGTAEGRNVADIYAASEMPEAERTPEQKAADREAFLNMTKKYSGENAIGPSQDYKLPADLKGSKPRYGYRDRQFQLAFEDKRDLAAYTVAQATPNKAHDRFMSWLRQQYPGESDAQIIARGSAVRERIKGMARDAAEDQNVLSVPSGEGLGPSGAFKGAPKGKESEAGSFSLRPKKLPPNQQPGLVHPLAEIKAKGSMMDRLSTAVHDMFVTSPEKQGAMNIIRTRTAEYAQHVQQASAAFDKYVKAHDSDGDAELRTFMDAGEGKPGAEFARPADMAAAQLLKEEFQDRWQKLSKLPGREEQGAGIENYLKHLFVGPKGQDLASRIMFGKRPLKGPATFTKHRFYEYMSDGLDNGLVPATYNPVRMQLLGLFEIDRYLMAHGMKNDMKAAGLVKFFKMGQDRPEGWQKINDEIFQPRVKVKGGRVEYGNYYAPKDAAKIFNNYLSPGLRGNLAYDIVRNYGNFLNQIQLGFSGFHAVGSSINASVNDVALGLMRLSKGQVGGIADIIKAPLSARTNYKLGKMIEEEYVNPGSHPELERLVRALKEGGGRIGLDPMWENRAVESFRRTMHSLNKPTDILKLGFHGIEAMAEKFSAPLMKYYVPRLKIGAFAKLAEFKLGELTKEGASREQIQTELGKIWDSIDNRMGQFTYDNLFWQRTAKDLAFLSVRSFGWTFGSLREAGGATADTFRQLQRMKEGQSPELTARMAYTIALPIVVGTLGTIMGTLMGHPPQNLEDRFFPQGGGVDASGKPSRWSFPSYMRDVYSFKRAPAETLVHKMHPALAQLAELYQNHDFYNTEIRDPYAPLWKQAVQVGDYMAKGYIPFGVRNTMQRRNEGESWKSAIGGEVGFTPAPRYIGQTKAEEIASDLAQRHMEKGPFPQGTQEKRQEFYRVRNQFHAGKLNSGDLLNLVKSGKLSPKQAGHIVSEKGQPPLIRHFNTQGMSWDERFKIWDAATPTEKTELKPYLLKHVKSAQSEPPDVRDAIYKRLREIFVPHQ